jgi:multidrug efflux pump subunit AcrA (membrane-fusion protein)
MDVEQLKADLAAAEKRAQAAEDGHAVAVRMAQAAEQRAKDARALEEDAVRRHLKLAERTGRMQAELDEAVALLREASQDVQPGWTCLGCSCLAGPLYDQILALLACIDAAKDGTP